MSDEKNNYQRNKRRIIFGLFNEKQKQITYALTNVFVALVVILVINAISLFKFSQISSLCFNTGGDFNTYAMTGHISFMIYASAVALLLAGLICFAFVVVLTHRFFGPMVAIRRHISQLAQGNYDSRVSLRKNDELKELAEQLNHLAESLEKKK